MTTSLSPFGHAPLLLLPLLLGIGVLRLCGVRWHDDRLAFTAWIWPAGTLSLAAVLLGCLLTHVPPAHWVSVVAAATAALHATVWRRRATTTGAVRAAGGGWLFACALAIGVVITLYAMLSAAAEPCVVGDEGSLWSMKAKALWFDWYAGDFRHGQRLSTHADYPLLNPLLQAWTYSLAGGITLFENRLPIQLATLALVLATAAALRRHGRGWLASLLLSVLLLDPSQRAACLAAEADGMVALGLVVALDGWLRARASDARGHRAMLAIGFAFALAAKNEAVMYALATMLAASLCWIGGRRHLGATKLEPAPSAAGWRWCVLPLAVIAWHAGWNRWFGFQNDLAGGNPRGESFSSLFTAQFCERIGPVLLAGVRLLTSLDRAHGVLLLVLLAPLLWPRRAFTRSLGVVTLALLGSVVGVHLVYIGSWLELQYHLTTSHARVLYQLVPASLVWFAAVFGRVGSPGATTGVATGTHFADASA